jgi:hypothetical protein
MIYPAGEYTNKQYTRTDTATPLVLVRTENQGTYSNAYYYLVANNNGTLGSYISPTTPNQKCWQQATQYQVILADALMANFAKLASAVFWGDYMFSQYGDRGSNYQDFDNDDILNEDGDNFRPNVLVNWLTGYAHFAGGKVVFDENGNVNVEGTIEVNTLYHKKRELLDDTTISTSNLSDTYRCAANKEITVTLSSLQSADYDGIELTFVNTSGYRVKLSGNYFCFTRINNSHLEPYFNANYVYIPSRGVPVKLQLVQNALSGWGWTWYVVSGIVSTS